MAASKTRRARQKPAAASKNGAAEAKAAQKEKSGDAPTIEFMGMKIVLPPKLRESVIWRFGILREDDFQGAARLVQSVIGQDQFALILDKLDEEEVFVDERADDDEDPAVSPMAELLEKALAVYGLTPGESKASTDS